MMNEQFILLIMAGLAFGFGVGITSTIYEYKYEFLIGYARCRRDHEKLLGNFARAKTEYEEQCTKIAEEYNKLHHAKTKEGDLK